jgi:DNA invertase Pin-like site-specific DNA recombinase
MRTVHYYRVSTAKQGRSGLGLEAQRSAVEAFCHSRGCQSVGEYVEVESGKRNDRPELAKALHHAKVTGATVIIAKLDRLGRNIAFLTMLQEAGVKFIAADNPDANELTIHILAAMAQAEAKAISTRTKEALKAAKARGARLGNPMGAEAFGDKAAIGREMAAAANRDQAQAFAVELRPIIDAIRADGHTSLRQIAAELDRRGIMTARGGSWSPNVVNTIIARTSDI